MNETEHRPPARDGDVQAWARALVAIAIRIATPKRVLQSDQEPPQAKKAA